MFCIAEGLARNESLQSLSLEGNPLGAQGLNYLMRARTLNKAIQFKINLKMVENEVDSKMDQKLFSKDSPEDVYCLDLELEYDYWVLQHLLQISLELAQNS